MKELRQCEGVVKNISDGTWENPGKRCQCYEENETAFVFYDAVPEADYHTSRSIDPFDKRSGIRIVIAHGEINLVLQIMIYDVLNLSGTHPLRFTTSSYQ